MIDAIEEDKDHVAWWRDEAGLNLLERRFVVKHRKLERDDSVLDAFMKHEHGVTFQEPLPRWSDARMCQVSIAGVSDAHTTLVEVMYQVP